MIDSAVVVESRPVGPDASEDKVHLEQLLRGVIRDVLRGDEALEQLAQDLDVSDVGDGSDLAESMLDHLLKRWNVLVEEDREVRFLGLKFKFEIDAGKEFLISQTRPLFGYFRSVPQVF